MIELVSHPGVVQARLRTDAIKAHLTGARELLLESYEARDWETLGYGSWREWAVEEFGQSQRSLYEQLEAAQLQRDLPFAESAKGVPFAQLRPLAALDTADERREVWREAVETAPNGKVTAAHVEAVVERRLNHGVFTSETPEWYTPPLIIESVVRALGAIDLDPCSNPGAPNIPAAQYFTAAEDGLAQPWSGRVYMNPPYGDAISAWVEKLVGEVSDGRVHEAIALIPARTDTAWWRLLRDCAVCFVRGRLRFSGAETSAPFPSAAAYFGPRRDAFKGVFSDIGDVWERVSP